MQWKLSISKGMSIAASWSFSGWLRNVSGVGTGVRIQAGPHSEAQVLSPIPPCLQPSLSRRRCHRQREFHQEVPGMFWSALTMVRGQNSESGVTGVRLSSILEFV